MTKQNDEGDQKHFNKIKRQKVSIYLMMLDAVAINLAVIVSAGIRHLLVPFFGGMVNWPLILRGLAFYTLISILLAWLIGLYPGFGLPAVQEMQKIVYVVTLTSILLGVYLFLEQLGLAYSRSIFLASWFLSMVFLGSGRYTFRKHFSNRSWYGHPIGIIGNPESAETVINQLFEYPRLGFHPVFYYDPEQENSDSIQKITIVHTIKELRRMAQSVGIQHVIFTNPPNEMTSLNFAWFREHFPNILILFNTSPYGSLWVKTIDLNGTLAVEIKDHLLNTRQQVFKQILDLTLTGLILLLIWPLFFLLSVLIWFDSKGPIIYIQERLGKDERIINIYKFRTMLEDSDEKLRYLLKTNPEKAQEYAKYHKLSDDPRITRIGLILRRFSLDELPQLINVFKGDMNLIGPRSYLPRELPAIGDYANIILKVKPGLTGWWQVMGRNATTFEERLQLDEYYISNWSIWLDIFIAIKTIWVLISGQGL